MFSNRPSRRALYLQVRDVLAKRIANREWKPGFAVPNEADLARELGVSAGTVRKALGLLEEGRLVTRRQGKGTFVRDQTSDGATERFDRLRGPNGERVSGVIRPAEITQDTASEQDCRRLGLRAGAAVYRIHRLRRIGERDVLVEDATLPAALFPSLGDKRKIPDDISSLAHEYGVLLGRAEERISMDVAPVAAAKKLGVASGSRVMTLDRVTFTLDGGPVEWRMAYCNPAGVYYLAELS